MSIVKDAIASVVNDNSIVQTIVATVFSVDKQDFTCDVTPLRGDADIYKVRLKASVGSEDLGVVLFPEVGSSILVSFIDKQDTQAFVSAFDSVESCNISIGNKFVLKIDANGNVDLDANKITMNGGSNGSLLILPKLIQEIQKLNLFLNTIRNAIGAAPVAPTDGGASFKASLIAALSTQQVANLTDLGNDKITH